MSDSPQADASQVVELGAVSAASIAKALSLPETHVPVIKRAIADEINAMSSHFTLAFADIQTQYEAAVYQAKLEYTKAIGTFNFVKSNVLVVVGSAAALFLAGFGLGYFV